jgi:hypothetical protein
MKTLLAALALAGCVSGPKPGPWVVSATTDASTARQALALVDAAKRLMPDSPLEYGGDIRLLPDINALCYPHLQTDMVISGCLNSAVYVRWPLRGCADLTCSALPHELCHVGQGYTSTDVTAGACALLVTQEYRRGMP